MKRRKFPVRKGFKLIGVSPSTIVGIVNYKDRIIVAAEDGVYELIEDKLIKIPLTRVEETNENP